MTRATYQLSLLGDPPKRGKEWTPTLYVWDWCGLTMPLDDAATRQGEMLTRETRHLELTSRDTYRGEE